MTDTFERPFATASLGELYELKGEYLGVVLDGSAHVAHREAAAEDLALVERELAVRECICPLAWSGHGEPKPDPKRMDPDCLAHASEVSR